VNDDKEDLYSRAAQRFARHEDEHSAAECFMETLGMTPKGLRTALRAESEAKKRKADLSGRSDQLNSSTDRPQMQKATTERKKSTILWLIQNFSQQKIPMGTKEY